MTIQWQGRLEIGDAVHHTATTTHFLTVKADIEAVAGFANRLALVLEMDSFSEYLVLDSAGRRIGNAEIFRGERG